MLDAQDARNMVCGGSPELVLRGELLPPPRRISPRLPNDRAGFIDVPVIGPPNSASRPTVPPIASAAAAPTARVSVVTATITNSQERRQVIS